MLAQPATDDLPQALLEAGPGLLVTFYRRTAQQLEATRFIGELSTTVRLDFPSTLFDKYADAQRTL
jgi:hypothetical protein